MTLVLWICAATALGAAAASHAAIVLLTRVGAIVGPFATYRHDAVVSTLILSASLACSFGALAAAGSICAELRPGGNHLAAALSRIPRLSLGLIGPIVFVLQILALCAGEALEQTQQFGHPLGGAALLGGVPLIALTLSAAIAFAFSALVLRALAAANVALRKLARVIAPLVRRLVIDRSAVSPAIAPVAEPIGAYRRACLALHIANRPPPVPALS